MMYRVQLAPATAEYCKSLNPVIRKQIKAGLKVLCSTPYAGKELREDLAGFWSYRIKRYRVVYAVRADEKVVKVYMIGHRKDIYELFAAFVKLSAL